MSPDRFWNRTRMVVAARGSGCCRQDDSGGIRNRSSLERIPWGTLLSWSLGLWYTHVDATVQEERLWIADPKAIHHILHSPGSLYVKPSVHMEKNAMLTD